MFAAKILIAAGGTGGHIYPALALADALRTKNPAVEIVFVGTPYGLENQIIPKHNYRLEHVPIGRLNSNVRLTERLGTLLKMPWALIQSLRILHREKPSLVVGVGGHASGPILLMAALLRYSTGIWEPNAMPGLANRILAQFVDECWVVFDEAKAYLKNSKLHRAGMPVRQEITTQESVRRPSREFHILVFGGSQGARGINNVVSEMIVQNGEWMHDIHFVHQTGPVDFGRIQDYYGSERLGSGQIQLQSYLNDMGKQYAWADLVICRAGTGTLSELSACGKPAILIPLPTASDDHQRKNAESLLKQGAADLILQKDLNPDTLRKAIEDLRHHPERLHEMGRAVRLFHSPRAAENLADEFLERIQAHAPS